MTGESHVKTINELPESIIGYTASWLSNTDLYNLSLTNKDNIRVLVLADKDVSLSPYYSLRYMNDNFFKNKINDILKKRNTSLNLNFGYENDLKAFPNLSSVDKLLELNIGYIYNKIPKNLEKLLPPNLQKLKLNCSLGTAFPDLSSLNNLLDLDLHGGNSIWPLSSNNIIELLPLNLTKLKLNGFYFQTFPDLSALVKLIDLDLGKNELTSPDDNNLGKLFPQNLRALRLSRSFGMTTFPDLSCLDKLAELDLNDNNFPIFTLTEMSTIPDPRDIGKLLPINLEKLDLRNCRLKSFPDLRMLNKLVEIDLTNNDINIPENLKDLLPPSMDFEE
jgi:hypothetical protein